MAPVFCVRLFSAFDCFLALDRFLALVSEYRLFPEMRLLRSDAHNVTPHLTRRQSSAETAKDHRANYSSPRIPAN